MKNFKIFPTVLMSTVLISSTAFGFANNYNTANGDGYIVQDDKNHDENSKNFRENGYISYKASNLDNTSNSSFEVSVKGEKQESILKDKLFKFKSGYKKSKEEIEQCKSLLLEIRKTIQSNYSKADIDKIEGFTDKFKKAHKDLDVLSFKDVIVKHKDIVFDTPPVIKQGRTLIPLRAMAEGFGADVLWNDENNEVIVTREGNRIVIKTNEKTAIVNGRKITLDVEASIYGDRTYVPLRFIGENLDVDIEWDEDLRIIKIKEKDNSIGDNSYNVM